MMCAPRARKKGGSPCPRGNGHVVNMSSPADHIISRMFLFLFPPHFFGNLHANSSEWIRYFRGAQVGNPQFGVKLNF